MMRRPKLLAAILVWVLLPAPGRAADPPGPPPTQQQRDTVENWLARFLVMPQTTIWQFDPVRPYLGSGKLFCGRLNFQSLQRRYLGFKRFYAIMYDDEVTLAQIEDPLMDVSGRLRSKMELLCGKT